MAEKKFFFQDFLLEDMPVDEQDYPDVRIQTCEDYKKSSANIVISFDKLLRINKKEEWDSLFFKVKDRMIFIKDDVPIENQEVKPFRDFYLAVYFYTLSKYCEKCQVIYSHQEKQRLN